MRSIVGDASIARSTNYTKPLPRLSGRPTRLGGVARDDLQAALAFLLVASAGVHLAVTPAHLREFAAFGVFFVVAGLSQLAAALWCVRRASMAAVWFAAGLSAAIVLVWLMSRTIGLPIGPEAGTAEPVGLADVVSTIYEVAAVVISIAVARRLQPGDAPRMRLSPNAVTWAMAGTWVTFGAIFVGH